MRASLYRWAEFGLLAFPPKKLEKKEQFKTGAWAPVKEFNKKHILIEYKFAKIEILVSSYF